MNDAQPTTAPESPKDENPYEKVSEASLRFGKKSQVQPLNLDKATLDTEVTILLKGKINDLSGPGVYNEGRRIGIILTSCEIQSAEPRADNIDTALEIAAETRRRV